MHKFSVKKPLTIFVIMIAIVALGVVAYMKMTPDLLPNMDFPYVIVVTTYPGATPEKVEEEVSKPMEQAMATLEHIKQISSTSAENFSTVILEFEEDVNMDTIGVDIQQQILSLSGTWDDMVGTPYVLKINPSMLPVQVAGVSMEGMDTIELTNFLNETLMTKLEGIPGVARITADGMIQQELHVILDQDLIDAANQKVIDAINAEVDKAAGELEDQKAELEDTKDEMEGASGQMEAGVNQMINGEQQLNAEKNKLLKAQKELEEGMRTLKSTYEVLKLLNDRVEKVVATQTSTQQHLNDLTALQSQRLQLAELKLKIEAVKAEIAILEGVEEILPTDPTTPPATQATEPTEPNTEPATEATEPVVDATEPAAAALEPADPAVLDETAAEDPAMTIDVSTEEIMPLDLDDVELANLKLQLVQLEADLATKEAAYNAAMLAAGVTSDTLDKETLTAAAEAELAKAAVFAIDELLKTEGMDRQMLRDTLAELNSQIQQLEETAKQLESGLLTIEDAEKLLQEQKLKGLLQMSTAAGQMAAGAGTIDMALTQIETGLETIEDAREDSLRQADLNNIITMDMVSQILTAQNFAMPAGYVEQDGINYMVSVGEEITELPVLEDLLLFDMGMDGVDPIYLSDVAVVVMTDNRNETYAKLGTQDGVILSFEKQSTYATAKTTKNIAERFEELEAEYPGLKFDSLMNQGDYIFIVVDSILSNLLLGALFSVLILFIFLRDIRPTVITLCSIPISVVFAVVLMYFSGVTLNMISLSGLAISVGMLVDNSIVVIENIYRLRAKGANIVQAAVSGAGQVFGAITASTLTTVCVFFPIVFVEGITKQLFTDLALTVTYALMASLIIAITLVPAMAIGMLKKEKQNKEGRLGGALMGFYRKTVELALKGKVVVLILAGVMLLGSVGMGLSKGFIFFPDMDSPMITVSVEMPEDTTREEAIAIADEMLVRISEIEEIASVGAMMDTSSGTDAGISLTGGSGLSAYITLDSDKMSGAAVAKRIEESCADLPCTVSATSAIMDMSMLTGSGISVQIFADDMDALQGAAKDVAGLLERMEGVAEVSDGMEDAAPAYHVAIDRNEAMKNGLTVAQIYMELAAGLTKDGTVASLELDDISTDVVIEKPEGAVLDVQELRDYVFEVTDREGNIKEVPLSDFAKIEETTSLTSINRIDQRRYMTVTATLEEGYNVTLMSQEAEQIVAKADLGKGVSYAFAGENKMIMEAVEQMVLMLALGMLLVYLIMAAQFQSLKSPFVVMFTIPLAFTGGFMALMICGMEVSIISLVGFALLMGVIVNNGIVLVDYINQLRLEGKERREAIIEAGATRIRPILMTTLTTILGQLVMAISQDFGSRLMRPIAVVSIGGLLYATLMTLYVIPCIYDMVNKKELHKVDEKDLEILDL